MTTLSYVCMRSMGGSRSAPVPVGSYNVDEGFGLVFTPSLSRGTLCTFSARGAAIEQSRVARSSHDACFVMIA